MQPLRHLDLACLRLFVLTVDKGGLGRAAAVVGRSQPAASLQIKRLEEEVGETLLRRDGRGLALTLAGRELLPAARQIIELHDAALARRATARVSGPVRLGIAQDLADAVLTPVLADFARRHPALELLVRSDKMGELTEGIRDGALDIAVVFDTENGAAAGEILARMPMRWIGRQGEKWLKASSLRLVAFEGACCFNRAAEQALAEPGLAWRRTFTSASLASQWAAVRAGLGIGVRTALGLPADLAPIDPGAGLPALPAVDLRLLQRSGATGRAVADLAALIAAQGEIMGGARGAND